MDVGNWLRNLGFGQYEAVFRDSEIDQEVLPELTDADLEKLGVPLGHRKRLLKAIANLASPRQPTPPLRIASVPTDTDIAERRQLTVMFCDLVGSTALSAKLDPEDLHGVIAAYHRCCTGLVERNGGFVAKYMGDGVLAYFGYPEAHEDDPERAVLAGLAVVEAAPKLVTAAGSPLHVRIGIATGLVVVGDLVGSGEAQERGVVGETPNLAARLQGIAEPDGVVIADGTRRLLGDLFELRDLGLTDLKGVAKPVQAWAALRASSVESRFEALHPSGLTALVGREEECELLLRSWRRAKAGEGQVALLSGEPGIGKSRLTAELQERLRDEPHIRLRHFCSFQYRDSALYPFIARLERAAGFEREDDAAARLGKLEALLANSGEVNVERAGLFAELLGLAPGGRYPAPPGDPRRRRELTLAAFVEELATLSRQRPALLIFEDAQWADSTSLELFGRMVELAPRLPVLMIVTFRPEFSPPWMGQAHVTSLSLNRLARRETAALVEGVTGGKSLPPEILDRVVQRTDGVPLFIEELTKSLLEGGLLREEAGGYALAIPSSLQDALMARLDRLAGAKQVAQTAAIIGREFSYELLRAVSSLSEDELCGALWRLTESELILQRGDPPQARYMFKHALIQDAAYHSLLRANRRIQHSRVAEALEKLFPETAETQPELLAHHYTEAGLTTEAIPFWRKAGQRAVERSANVEALSHLNRGLALLRTLDDTTERAAEELTLQVTLGVPLGIVRGYASPEVRATYERARELCQQIGDTQELYPVLWALWRHHHVRAEFQVARELGEQLMALAERYQNRDFLLQAHHALWTTLVLLGEFTLALEHLERGKVLYDPQQHRSHAFMYGGHDPGVCCGLQRGYVLWYLGYPAQARKSAQEAIVLAQELSHAYTFVMALESATMIHQFCRDIQATQEGAERVLALAREQGFPAYASLATLYRGWALAEQGLEDVGITMLRQGMAAYRATGAGLGLPYQLARLAEACARTGQVQEGLGALTEALIATEKTGDRRWVAELYRLHGELTLQSESGSEEEAEESFRRAIAVASGQHAKSLELRATASLARLLAKQNRRDLARVMLADIYEWFTEGFDTTDLKEAKALLDEL
jgi:predicted ATPase/class 3 adenylate cyclase